VDSQVKTDCPILVTGATGRHGNTGEHLVRRLREAGLPVRVLARSVSERTDRLAALGAEIALGDLHDRRSLVPALTDVDLAYFTHPIDAGVVSAAANYASAVKQVGRRPRTVVMSMGPAHPDHPSGLGRAQWLAEQVLEWADLEVTILRVVALFHENIAVLHARDVRARGLIRNSFGENGVGWINGADAAELGLAALLHPARFPETIHYANGTEEFSHVDIAGMLSSLTGDPVRYESITKDQWRDDLLSLSQTDDVVNPAMAQHISAVGETVARSGRSLGADRAAFEALTGREPITMREFLLANLDKFTTRQRYSA